MPCGSEICSIAKVSSEFFSVAAAQNTISGQVKDTSGAVIAGATVEAASDALIERSRVVTTNSEGRYAVVDVRPGSYSVTLTSTGFSILKQQVEVPAGVAVTVQFGFALPSATTPESWSVSRPLADQ